MRSGLFMKSSESLYLKLLQDESFSSSIQDIIALTEQSQDDALHFVVHIIHKNAVHNDTDEAALLLTCLDAVKLSISDQKSLLLLMKEEKLSLKDALTRLHELQKIDDSLIEYPGAVRLNIADQKLLLNMMKNDQLDIDEAMVSLDEIHQSEVPMTESAAMLRK